MAFPRVIEGKKSFLSLQAPLVPTSSATHTEDSGLFRDAQGSFQLNIENAAASAGKNVLGESIGHQSIF